MSTDVTNGVDVVAESVEVTNTLSGDTVSANDHCVDIEIPESIVTGHKKEYSIVGDALYASVNTNDAPTWLTNLVDTLVTNQITAGFVDYDNLVQDVRNAIDSIDLASNNYVTRVDYNQDQSGIVNSVVTQLNATYDLSGIQSTITTLNTTIANELVAQGVSASQIQTNYQGYTDAAINTLDTTLSNAIGSYAASITALTAAYEDETTGLVATANAVSSLNTYVGLDGAGAPTGTGLLSRVNILEKQTDGVIEFIVDTYDVMIGIEDPNTNTTNDQLDVTKEPYASWIAADTTSGTEETRASHVGDVYVMYADDVNGTRTYIRSYKFIKTAPDATSPYSTDPEGYTWAVITDTDAQVAYTIALSAKDLADSKRRVFVDTPYPPYDVGDLWDRGATTGIWRAVAAKLGSESYNIADWQVIADKTSENTAASFVNQGALATLNQAGYTQLDTTLQGLIDGKTESWFQPSTSDPAIAWTTNPEKDKHVNDMWWRTDTNKLFIYKSDYTWEPITDQTAVDAYSNAATAQDTADGKRTVFITTPTGPYQAGDLWVDSTVTPKLIRNATVDRASGFLAGEWVVSDERIDDFVTNTYNPDSAQIHRQLDGKIEYYYYDSYTDVVGATSEASALTIIDSAWNTQALKDAANGDVVYFKDTRNAYWYQGANDVWLTITDTSIYEALQDAGTAQATADGKVSHFYGWYSPTNSAPAVVYESDGITVAATAASWSYWLKTDGKLYHRPDGVNWVQYTDVSEDDILQVFDPATKDITLYTFTGTSWAKNSPTGLVAGSKWAVDLDAYLGGNDGGGSWGGQTTLVNEITTTSKGEIQAAFSYDAELVSTAGQYYRSGFGLNTGTPTGGTGTQGDPFTSEFWVQADKFKVVPAGQSQPDASGAIFTVDAQTGDIIIGEDRTEATRNRIFRQNTVPAVGATGDVWFDTDDNILYLHDGVGYQPSASSNSVTASPTAPPGPSTGDLWFNTSTDVLSHWDGASWIAVSDITASHTAGDTANVNGISAAFIRAASGATFSNGFEDSEFADWVTQTGFTVAQDNGTFYSGSASGLFTSTVAKAQGADASGTTVATRIVIPEAVALAFGGRRVRISLYAKQPATNAATAFAVAYSTNDVGNSGWQQFTPTTSWTRFEFTYDVSNPGVGGVDYLGICGDANGAGNGTLVDLVTIETVANENELDALALINGPATSNADSTSGAVNTAGGVNVGTDGGAVRSGKTSYADTGAGWWIGRDAGVGKMHFGLGTKYLKWDGTNLLINDASLNVNNKFIVAADGSTTIQSATSGARMVMQNSVIKIYDGVSATPVVQLGDLSA